MRLELSTVEDTREAGRALASVLRPGDLVILNGPLGAGKTALAQGIGAGLRVLGHVTSPTFVIARLHRPDTARGGSLQLLHVDAYRLGGVAEVDDLDLEAALEESVTVVEWGGGKVEQLTDAYLEVRLQRRADDSRVADVVGHGGDWEPRLKQLAASLRGPLQVAPQRRGR